VRPGAEAPLTAGSSVFVDFDPCDATYVAALSNVLRQRGLRLQFAAVDADRQQNRLTNTELLRQANAIIYCWANALDAWLYAEAAENDWHSLGRAAPFLTRAAIVGPPQKVSKTFYDEHSPPPSIDLYVNLIKSGPQPSPNDLDPLVKVIPP
jgi:hypothetical protein